MNDPLNLFDSKRFIFTLVRLLSPASFTKAIPDKKRILLARAVPGCAP
jgi:hypothetical protein